MSNDTMDNKIASALYNSKKQSKSKIISPKETLSKEEGHCRSKSTFQIENESEKENTNR